MMITRFPIFTVVFALLSSFIIADPCRFEHSRGIIDLTTVGQSDGNPAYKDKIPTTGSNWKYSYNPCKPFTELGCVNVAACQTDGMIYTFVLGTQESAQWDAGAVLGGTPTVSYSEGPKRVEVKLECPAGSEPEEFEALGENPQETYKFRLKHKCACWNGCGASPQTTTKSSGGGGGGGGGRGGGLTGGGVFVILLVVLVFVYFVGFAVFYRYRHQRSGAELIPHRTFWGGLPGYAKDGVVYTYQRVANKGADPYQTI